MSLREKVWKLEIYPAAVISFIRRHPKGFITAITLSALIVVGLVRMSVRATESYFYPSSCLGVLSILNVQQVHKMLPKGRATLHLPRKTLQSLIKAFLICTAADLKEKF